MGQGSSYAYPKCHLRCIAFVEGVSRPTFSKCYFVTVGGGYNKEYAVYALDNGNNYGRPLNTNMAHSSIFRHHPLHRLWSVVCFRKSQRELVKVYTLAQN